MKKPKYAPKFQRLGLVLSLMTAFLTTDKARAAINDQPFTRCLSSEAGPFAQVDFRYKPDGIHIDTKITVVLGYTDRWIKEHILGNRVNVDNAESWSIFRLIAPTVESEQLLWFGISSSAEETGYNGFVYPGFLEVMFPTGEHKRFMLECYHLSGRYWVEDH